jgi:hypothetical protein
VLSSLRKEQRQFVTMVLATLADGRDWSRDHRSRRVSSGSYNFTVVLATPQETNRLCAPFDTGSINHYHWRNGAASYGWSRHLQPYREYVISHEIGHALGHSNLYHCRHDGLAPTMMQQTKSL